MRLKQFIWSYILKIMIEKPKVCLDDSTSIFAQTLNLNPILSELEIELKLLKIELSFKKKLNLIEFFYPNDITVLVSTTMLNNKVSF